MGGSTSVRMFGIVVFLFGFSSRSCMNTVEGRTLEATTVWFSGGPFGLASSAGEKVSIGASLPIRLPNGFSALARLNAHLPLAPLAGTTASRSSASKSADDAAQEKGSQQKQNPTRMGAGVGAACIRAIERWRGGLASAGVGGEVLLGLHASPPELRGMTVRCLAALRQQEPQMTLSASQGAHEVAATVGGGGTKGIRLVGFAAQSALLFSNARCMVETAHDFVKRELAVRLAGVRATGFSAPTWIGATLLPTWLGVDFRGNRTILDEVKKKASLAEKSNKDSASSLRGGEVFDGSVGLSLGFGKTASTVIHPRWHFKQKHRGGGNLSLEIITRFKGGGQMLLASVDLSRCLRLQWKDPTARNGSFWILTAAIPLALQQQQQQRNDETHKGAASFSIRRETTLPF